MRASLVHVPKTFRKKGEQIERETKFLDLFNNILKDLFLEERNQFTMSIRPDMGRVKLFIYHCFIYRSK